MASRNVQFYGSMNKALGGDPIQRDYAQDPRRLMAQQLMQQGSSTAPVQSPLEGLTRALSGVAGGYFGGQAQRDMQEREQALSSDISTAMEAATPRVVPATPATYSQSGIGDFEPSTPETKTKGGFAGIVDALRPMDNPDLSNFRQQALMGEMQQRQAAEQAALARVQKREDLENELKLKQKYPSSATGRPTSTIQDSRELTILQDNVTNATTAAGKADAKRKLNNFIEIKASDLKYIEAREKAKLQPKIEAAPLIAGATEQGKQSVIASGKAFETLAKVGQSIANIDDAILQIDNGANTGPIISMLPSFTAASVNLDNVQRRMGLDVIGNVTFGALSKGELDLALATALPTKLDPVSLKNWLTTKKLAQQKLARYVSKAAIYLGTPGNTVASWAKLQKGNTGQGGTPKRIKLDAQGNIIP
jgi:hypothetical protein